MYSLQLYACMLSRPLALKRLRNLQPASSTSPQRRHAYTAQACFSSSNPANSRCLTFVLLYSCLSVVVVVIAVGSHRRSPSSWFRVVYVSYTTFKHTTTNNNYMILKTGTTVLAGSSSRRSLQYYIKYSAQQQQLHNVNFSNHSQQQQHQQHLALYCPHEHLKTSTDAMTLLSQNSCSRCAFGEFRLSFLFVCSRKRF